MIAGGLLTPSLPLHLDMLKIGANVVAHHAMLRAFMLTHGLLSGGVAVSLPTALSRVTGLVTFFWFCARYDRLPWPKELLADLGRLPGEYTTPFFAHLLRIDALLILLPPLADFIGHLRADATTEAAIERRKQEVAK